MQPADKIVTPATERIHVAAPRTRHLARIPEFKKYAPPDPVRFRPKPSFDSGDLNGSSCPLPVIASRRDRAARVEGARAHFARGFRSSGIAIFSVRFAQRACSPAIRLPRASSTAVLAAKNGAVCAAPLHSLINLGWRCFPSTDTDYWKAPGGIGGKEGLSQSVSERPARAVDHTLRSSFRQRSVWSPECWRRRIATCTNPPRRGSCRRGRIRRRAAD
jgi:hypothetical protein